MAEWLGSALQKQLQRFESASDLQIKPENPVNIALAGFLLYISKKHTKMTDSKKCPSCGAEIPTVAIKCEFCGLEIKSNEVNSLDVIKELQDKLIAADNSFSAKDAALYGEAKLWNQKASIINAFTLPATKKGLIDLLIFSCSNVEGAKGTLKIYGDPIKNAWIGKAKQAYKMLKIYGKNDEQIKSVLEEYSYLETFNSKSKKGCLPFMLLMVAGIFAYLI